MEKWSLCTSLLMQLTQIQTVFVKHDAPERHHSGTSWIEFTHIQVVNTQKAWFSLPIFYSDSWFSIFFLTFILRWGLKTLIKKTLGKTQVENGGQTKAKQRNLLLTSLQVTNNGNTVSSCTTDIKSKANKAGKWSSTSTVSCIDKKKISNTTLLQRHLKLRYSRFLLCIKY